MPLTIIAIHGNGGGAFRFERMLPFVPDHVQFHALTLPGFADEPRDASLTTLPRYADHLHKMIPATDGPLILLGTGIGGTIALDYAQRHRVDGIILHAPVGTRLDTRLFPRLMRLPGMTTLGQRLFSSPVTRPLFKRLLFHRPLPREFTNRFFDEYAQCSVFGQMFEIITSEWFNSLRPIETPTALLCGENERVLTVDQLEDYKRLLPNHLVHTEAGWDHFPMIEQPAAYADVVIGLARQLID